MSFKSEPGGECGENCKIGTGSPTTPPVVDEAEAERLEILTQDVFSNLLIRKEILKSLEIPDLLRASLVCKGWNILAREVLQKDRRVNAAIQETY